MSPIILRSKHALRTILSLACLFTIPTMVSAQLGAAAEEAGVLLGRLFGRAEQNIVKSAARESELALEKELAAIKAANAARRDYWELGLKSTRINNTEKIRPNAALDETYSPDKFYKNPADYGVIYVKSEITEGAASFFEIKKIVRLPNYEYAAFNSERELVVFKLLHNQGYLKLYSSDNILFKFRNAIAAYQAAAKLPVTLTVDRLTYQHITTKAITQYLGGEKLLAPGSIQNRANKINICLFQRSKDLPVTGALDSKTNKFILDKVLDKLTDIKDLPAVAPDFSLDSRAIGNSFGSGFRFTLFPIHSHSSTTFKGPFFNYEYFTLQKGKIFGAYGPTPIRADGWREISDPGALLIIEELHKQQYVKGDTYFSKEDLLRHLYGYKIDHKIPLAHKPSVPLTEDIEFMDVSKYIEERSERTVSCKKSLNIITGSGFEPNGDITADFQKSLQEVLSLPTGTKMQTILPAWEKALLVKRYEKQLLTGNYSFTDTKDFLRYRYEKEPGDLVGYWTNENSGSFYIFSSSTESHMGPIVFKRNGVGFEHIEDIGPVLSGYLKHVHTMIDGYSNERTAYFYLNALLSDETKIVLSYNQHDLTLTTADFIRYQEGSPLSKKGAQALDAFKKEHFNNKSVVIYYDPLAFNLLNSRLRRIPMADQYNYTITGTSFYLFAKNQLNITDIYYARDLEASARRLPDIKVNVNSFQLAVPAKGDQITDYGVNAFLQKILPAEFLKKDMSVSDAEILLTLGHKDEHYLGFVERLRAQGMFKNKIWASYSCFEVADEALALKLLRDEGARGIFYFGSTINPFATREILKQYQKLASAGNLDVIEKVKQAVKNAIKENPRMESEINNIYESFIFQIAVNNNHLSQNNIAA